MNDFPEPLEDSPRDVRPLLAQIRRGFEAEEELWVLCQSEPMKAWLRDQKVLDQDSTDPKADELVADALTTWHDEITRRKDAVARFRGPGTFLKWLRTRIGSARLAALDEDRDRKSAERWAAGVPVRKPRVKARQSELESQPDKPEPPNAVDSHLILIRKEMQQYEPLFERSTFYADDPQFFEVLCRTLFRSYIWRYLVRRARDPKANAVHWRVAYPRLAVLVFGFDLDERQRQSQSKTIRNWLKPSMDKFEAFLEEQKLRRIWDEVGDDPD